jgi:hypothetical protein
MNAATRRRVAKLIAYDVIEIALSDGIASDDPTMTDAIRRVQLDLVTSIRSDDEYERAAHAYNEWRQRPTDDDPRAGYLDDDRDPDDDDTP